MTTAASCSFIFKFASLPLHRQQILRLCTPRHRSIIGLTLPPIQCSKSKTSEKITIQSKPVRILTEIHQKQVQTFPSTVVDHIKHKKQTHRYTYLLAALASSVGITSLAAASIYYRFVLQMEGAEVSWTDIFGTFSLVIGAAVGMDSWARWAHRALWHGSLWSMHESHHGAREDPFELNDIFAIINAIPAISLIGDIFAIINAIPAISLMGDIFAIINATPAISLIAYGSLNKGFFPSLSFGAGLGITVFGMAYMFIHDGLVHQRFHVGPIADVPYFQKVAAAHKLHHAEKFNGVPYGLFLGPMELEEVGRRQELEKPVQKLKRERTNPIKH